MALKEKFEIPNVPTLLLIHLRIGDSKGHYSPISEIQIFYLR